jgi:hypothetical protein
MKLTTQRLKQLIKEELQATLREGKEEALKMIMDLQKGDDLGMILEFDDLKKFVSSGEKEKALEEIGYMYEGTETAGQDELLKELESLIKKM